jgi:hypothetical protein
MSKSELLNENTPEIRVFKEKRLPAIEKPTKKSANHRHKFVGRNKTIIRLVTVKGADLKSVAKKYKISRERVRQLVDKEESYGNFVTLRTVAQIFKTQNENIPLHRIYLIVKKVVRKCSTIRKRVVFRISRTKKRRRMYVVHRNETPKIEEIILKQKLFEKLFQCIECGTAVNSTGKKLCGQCAQNKIPLAQKKYSHEIKSGERKVQSRTPWIVQSIKLIKKNKVNFHDETWITQSEANKMAGLLNGFRSLILLRQQGLLKTHKNHEQKHKGKTILLYAKSEMDIIYSVRKRLGLIQKPQI